MERIQTAAYIFTTKDIKEHEEKILKFGALHNLSGEDPRFFADRANIEQEYNNPVSHDESGEESHRRAWGDSRIDPGMSINPRDEPSGQF